MPEETAEKLSLEEAIDAGFAKATADAESTVADDGEQDSDTKGQEENNQPEQTDKAAGQADEAAEENIDLLSKEDRDKLDEKGKEAYKKIMKAYTQKTQELSRERKEFEKNRDIFDKYKNVLESLEDDPKETLIQLNKMYDIKVADQETKPDAAEVNKQADRMEEQLKFGHNLKSYPKDFLN